MTWHGIGWHVVVKEAKLAQNLLLIYFYSSSWMALHGMEEVSKKRMISKKDKITLFPPG
jgi:hypothetical protein